MTKRWKPPWHRGFGWLIFSVCASVLVWFIMPPSRNTWYWGLLPGMGIGSFLWSLTWHEWEEFGPDWDGGM